MSEGRVFNTLQALGKTTLACSLAVAAKSDGRRRAGTGKQGRRRDPGAVAMAVQAATTQTEDQVSKTDLAGFLRLSGAGTSPGKCSERAGKKGFVVYLNPELLHQVKPAALAEHKTLQQVSVEALEEMVAKRGT